MAFGALRLGREPRLREAEVVNCCHELLLGTVMKVPREASSVGIGRLENLPRAAGIGGPLLVDRQLAGHCVVRSAHVRLRSLTGAYPSQQRYTRGGYGSVANDIQRIT